MSKLNLKHVPGIMKVVMRRKGNILFSIHGGEVYKVSREKPLRWKLVTFLRISWFLERILKEHIQSISSLNSKLIIESICSIRVCSGNWEILKKSRKTPFPHYREIQQAVALLARVWLGSVVPFRDCVGIYHWLLLRFSRCSSQNSNGKYRNEI